MVNISDKLKETILKIVSEKYSLDRVEFTIETPKDTTHGDFATNIAMNLARELKKSPLIIANEIVEELTRLEIEEVETIEVANPGFINFKLRKETLVNLINVINQIGENYGKSDIGKDKKVMVEFGQPNTHKAFHVGHLKSAVSGLAMVKLHENLGYSVIKVNFYGDIGMHVAKSTWGFINSPKPDDFNEKDVHQKMKFIDSCYVFASKEFKEKEEVEKKIRDINKEIYQQADTENVRIYKYLREISLEHQKEVWKTLGIVYDREYPESEVYKDAVKIVGQFKDKIFTQSEGAIIFKGEEIGLTNWVFLTSENNPTYSAKDLALGYKKFEEYPDLYKSIVTTSVEIRDYFKVIIHLLGIINPVTLGRYFHIPFGWMLRGGRKFSSRMGESVKGIDIIEEVQKVAYEKISLSKEYSYEEKSNIVKTVADGGLKFLILSHEFHKDFSYDPNQFLSMEGFSGPYVQYTYSRAKSIIEKSQDTKFTASVVTSEDEILLIKLLEQYPRIAEEAGLQIEPHLICNYVYKLSQLFNIFYTNNSVLNAESEEIKVSRLAITAATAQVLKNGLSLLGIDTVEKM